MAKYLVQWTIDIDDYDDVDSPRKAAQKAHKFRSNKGTHANVYVVTDKTTRKKFEVDLLERSISNSVTEIK